MGDDVDIYGDLYSAPATASALPSTPATLIAAPPAGAALAVQPPVMTPPTSGAPPARRVGDSGFYQNMVWSPRSSPAAAPAKVDDVEEPMSGMPGPPAEAAWEDWAHEDGFVVEAGEVISNTKSASRTGRAAEAPKPEDFEALQRELLADDRPAPAPGSSPDDVQSISSGCDSDATDGPDEDIQLGEVRASETGAASRPFVSPRKWKTARPNEAARHAAAALEGGSGASSSTKRTEVALFLGPPPPAPAHALGTADCLLLAGGLPWWLTDAELRRSAEQFGQIRTIRILDFTRSGKSAGIALVEYVMPEGAQRAVKPTEGLSALAVWQAMDVAAPRLVLVSGELFKRLRTGRLPWPDGGPCSDELRTILMRQFDQSYASTSANSRQRHFDDSPSRVRRSRRSATTTFAPSSGNGARGGSPEPPPRREEAWADKLKTLKRNVNHRQDVGYGAATDPRAKARRL